MLIGSTNSLTPCDSNTWSPEPWPFSSIIRPYWNPEQPPPCTKTRRPLLALFSSASNSLIFEAAVSETLIMRSLYQDRGWYTARLAHAIRFDPGVFPGHSARIGAAAVAGHPRDPARARTGAGPAAGTADAHGRPGRHARRRPPAPLVAAAEVSRGQAGARRSGAGRRADPVTGPGADAGPVPVVRRAHPRRRRGGGHAHS